MSAHSEDKPKGFRVVINIEEVGHSVHTKQTGVVPRLCCHFLFWSLCSSFNHACQCPNPEVSLRPTACCPLRGSALEEPSEESECLSYRRKWATGVGEGRACNHFPPTTIHLSGSQRAHWFCCHPGILALPISLLVRLAFRLAGQTEAGAKGSPARAAAN